MLSMKSVVYMNACASMKSNFICQKQKNGWNFVTNRQIYTLEMCVCIQYIEFMIKIESHETITSGVKHFMHHVAFAIHKLWHENESSKIINKLIKSMTIQNHIFRLSSAWNDEYSVEWMKFNHSVSLILRLYEYVCVNIFIFRIYVPPWQFSRIKVYYEHDSVNNNHMQHQQR